MANRTREDLAWAAGIFEGEGCFHVSERGKGIILKAAVAMSDEDVIERFARIVGFGVSAPRGVTSSKHRAHWKPMYEWRVQNFEHVQALIAMFWPWLGERRRARAREVLVVARDHGWLRNYCKRGHLRTEANTRWEANSRTPDGRARRCLDCRRPQERDRARKRLNINPENYRVS